MVSEEKGWRHRCFYFIGKEQSYTFTYKYSNILAVDDESSGWCGGSAR